MSPRLDSRRAFWVVAFAFLVVMAFATVPSPLYGLVIGLGLAVAAVWMGPPPLAVFIAGGVLIGGGGGAIFRGAVATVMGISSPDRMAESVAALFLSAFVGISLPVVGAGIALARQVSPQVTRLGFAIAVSARIAGSAIKLVAPEGIAARSVA